MVKDIDLDNHQQRILYNISVSLRTISNELNKIRILKERELELVYNITNGSE